MTAHDPDAETDEWITHPTPSPAATLTDQQMLDELVRRGTLSSGRVRLTSMHGHQSDALAALERATADVRRQIEETETRGAMESLAEDVSNAPPDQIIDTRPPGDYADSTPSMTVHLPAGMTSPSILRLVADEVRREPLGWGGKPKSLPRTLDELADAMDDARKRAVGNP